MTWTAEDQRLSTRLCSKKRRDRNREAGACINENRRGEHGPATHGVRCKTCAALHSGSARRSS